MSEQVDRRVAIAVLGGHVCVGFEHNLHFASGATATGSAQLVRACGEVLEHLGLRSALRRDASPVSRFPRAGDNVDNR